MMQNSSYTYICIIHLIILSYFSFMKSTQTLAASTCLVSFSSFIKWHILCIMLYFIFNISSNICIQSYRLPPYPWLFHHKNAHKIEFSFIFNSKYLALFLRYCSSFMHYLLFFFFTLCILTLPFYFSVSGDKFNSTEFWEHLPYHLSSLMWITVFFVQIITWWIFQANLRAMLNLYPFMYKCTNTLVSSYRNLEYLVLLILWF